MGVGGGVVVERLPEDEAEIAEQARAGSGAAFSVLFDRHHRRIYNHCFRQTASWAEAEDLASVVFLEAWRNRHRLHVHEGSALPWLYGISTNVCRNRLRSLRRHRGALARLTSDDVSPDHADDVAGRLDDERRMAWILSAIDQLPQRERDVIALCLWEELDYAAAAQALGVPIGTVRSRLSRARARLSDALTTSPSGNQP